MTGSGAHPSESDWIEWTQAGCDPKSDLALHAEGCDRCGESLELFRTLSRAGRVSEWRLPPEAIRNLALDVEKIIAPPEPGDASDGSWIAPDIRSAGVLDPSGPRIATGQVGSMRISVVAAPSPGDLSVQIRGKVFIDEGDAGGESAVQVLLVHEDHVIARRPVSPEGDFWFVEHAPRGWTLEVHRDRGECWILRDSALP
ncbi:MAG: hypothetical protein IPK72_00080 [Candidatus Eisenbacteria bacterium]|nr:hypothetical protein [Candidatus Eisenbacteria bacterium]